MSALELGRPYTIRELKQANKRVGKHFFDEGALRFFDSKVHSVVYPVADGWLFLTSEQFHDLVTRISHPRRYTIRKMLQNADIETVGEFQEFPSFESA